MQYGSTYNDLYTTYGCNDYDVTVLVFDLAESAAQIRAAYKTAGLDTIKFPIVAKEGGAYTVGRMMRDTIMKYWNTTSSTKPFFIMQRPIDVWKDSLGVQRETYWGGAQYLIPDTGKSVDWLWGTGEPDSYYTWFEKYNINPHECNTTEITTPVIDKSKITPDVCMEVGGKAFLVNLERPGRYTIELRNLKGMLLQSISFNGSEGMNRVPTYNVNLPSGAFVSSITELLTKKTDRKVLIK